MKTRTLLLLSLACALAIVAAGVALGVRVASNPEATPPAPLGTPVEVGDMSTVVESASVSGGSTVVSMRVGGVDDPDVSGDFTLIVAGVAFAVSGGDCDPARPETRPCRLEFPTVVESGTQVVMTQSRGEEQVRWVLVIE